MYGRTVNCILRLHNDGCGLDSSRSGHGPVATPVSRNGLWVPHNVQTFLTSYATISFSLKVTHNTSECNETVMKMGTLVITKQPC